MRNKREKYVIIVVLRLFVYNTYRFRQSCISLFMHKMRKNTTTRYYNSVFISLTIIFIYYLYFSFNRFIIYYLIYNTTLYDVIYLYIKNRLYSGYTKMFLIHSVPTSFEGREIESTPLIRAYVHKII